MPTVLSIGTTHPLNVAGIGRDLIVGSEYGCNVVSAVAAITAQDDRALQMLHVLPANVLEAQLGALDHVLAYAMRVGALGSTENVGVVAMHLIARHPVWAVVDPVLQTSTGGALIDERGFAMLGNTIGRIPNVILTPNLVEAAVLLGRDSIVRSEMEAAARELRARGCAAVLIKGGHLADGDSLVDVLATEDGVECFEGARIAGSMQGTGCTLAMAIACELARGRDIRDAVIGGRAYLREKMTANARGE